MQGTKFLGGVDSVRGWEEGLFLGSVACLGVLGGFAMTVARVKKRNPASFMKGVLANPELDQMESGASVGLRALGWGTVFALTGVGTISFVFCKLIGVSSVSLHQICKANKSHASTFLHFSFVYK
ncbi:putative transmembrane protein [Apostichopus japonicus]|uniref:Transmembrane protein 242 n=1 Tax=Stichopus japonicus TaxID=307972 RepID=A0A2G8KYE0_STIJA|nr:putative transmembrane protein [Apostichopus japonicus]